MKDKDRLDKKQRRRVRDLAREAWVEADGNPQRAKRLARTKIREQLEVGSAWTMILVSIAIRLAFMLIEWWFSNRIAEPGKEPIEGEPVL